MRTGFGGLNRDHARRTAVIWQRPAAEKALSRDHEDPAEHAEKQTEK